MAIEFIKVDRTVSTAVFANDLIGAVNALRNAINGLDKVKQNMGKMFDAQALDFSTVEANYGIPSGQGQAVYNMVNGARGSLSGTFQSTDGDNLIARVG